MLVGQVSLVHFLFRLPRAVSGHGLHIDDRVVEHGEIYVIDGYLDVRAVGVRRRDIFLRIDDFAGHQARHLLFQDMIGRLSQVLVDGEIDILARLGLLALLDGNHLAHIVHDDLFVALFPLERGLQISLDAALSHHVIDIVDIASVSQLLHLDIEIRQLVGGNLTGIAQHMGEVLTVHVSADRAGLNRHAGQGLGILHDHGHCPLIDIGGHCGPDIFSESGKVHGISDCDHFQPVLSAVPLPRQKSAFTVVRLLVFSDGEPGRTAEVLHDFIRGGSALIIL